MNSIKHITSRLLATNNNLLLLEDVKNKEPEPLALKIHLSFVQCMSALNHQELKDNLLDVMLNNKSLLSLALKNILYDCKTDMNVTLILGIFQRNPQFKAQHGQSIKLGDYFCSQHHEIKSVHHFEKIFSVLSSLDYGQIQSSAQLGTLKLMKYRRWIAGEEAPVPERLTLVEFAKAVSVHLGLESDTFLLSATRYRVQSSAIFVMRRLICLIEGNGCTKLTGNVGMSN